MTEQEQQPEARVWYSRASGWLAHSNGELVERAKTMAKTEENKAAVIASCEERGFRVVVIGD
jgi:hypothetical protein